jgi:predicted SprT family Zn-dependent metalloprotease
MYIFDETSLAFAQKSMLMVREILSKAGLVLKTNRFEYKGILYPLRVTIFEGKELGHFDAAFYQIGLNRKLVYLAKDAVVRDILSHELAHYLTHIIYGEVRPHGQEFHQVCAEFNFSKEISSATLNMVLSNESKQGDLASERILEKIKKLFSLAQSSNPHESQLATLKANKLLLQHHLNYVQDQKSPIYMERVLHRPRKDAKILAIQSILKHFMVLSVVSQGHKTCCLEVSGSLTNVELAIYVSHYLDREFDHLWREAQKEFNLSGIRAKNSFFRGIGQGYEEKMKSNKMDFSPEDQKSLMVLARENQMKASQIYKHLSHSTTQQKNDPRAQEAGQKKGRNLSIKNAVSSHKVMGLLSFKE